MSSTPSPHGRSLRSSRATAVRTGRAAAGHDRHAEPVVRTLPTVRESSGHSVHDYARRMAFLTELDSQTWLARYSAAERLGDPDAVTSVPNYAAWLRRTAAAWSAVPMPTIAQATAVWPFTSLPASALNAAAQIELDLRETALATGGPRGRGPAPRPAGFLTQAAREDIDSAYVAAAAYVAVAAGQEVAVLAADVEHLSATASRTALPQHYVRHSLQVATMRNPMRRELADWADTAGPDAAERVLLAARMLVEHLASALVTSTRAGW